MLIRTDHMFSRFDPRAANCFEGNPRMNVRSNNRSIFAALRALAPFTACSLAIDQRDFRPLGYCHKSIAFVKSRIARAPRKPFPGGLNVENRAAREATIRREFFALASGANYFSKARPSTNPIARRFLAISITYGSHKATNFFCRPELFSESVHNL